jgi:hypothetical protein
MRFPRFFFFLQMTFEMKIADKNPQRVLNGKFTTLEIFGGRNMQYEMQLQLISVASRVHFKTNFQ